MALVFESATRVLVHNLLGDALAVASHGLLRLAAACRGLLRLAVAKLWLAYRAPLQYFSSCVSFFYILWHFQLRS
jgi:hypothetical protein